LPKRRAGNVVESLNCRRRWQLRHERGYGTRVDEQ
jgi:hypothetical protein